MSETIARIQRTKLQGTVEKKVCSVNWFYVNIDILR